MTTSATSPETSSSAAAASTPVPTSSAKLGANLNRGQTAALIATPLGTLLAGIIVYLWWRRRRGTGSSQAHSSRLSPSDGPNMAESGLRRWTGSPRSSGAPPSVATTDILMADDESGPLRSHPVTMLGPVPQSPWQESNGASGSFKSAQADPSAGASSSPDHSDDNDSTHAGPVLGPFGQEFMHGHIRYSQSPMRYVTKLSDAQGAGSAEAMVDQGAERPSPKNSKDSREVRHHSWTLNRWTRSRDRDTSSAPDSPWKSENDWVSPVNWNDIGARRFSLRQEYVQRQREAEGGEDQRKTSNETDLSGGDAETTMTRA